MEKILSKIEGEVHYINNKYYGNKKHYELWAKLKRDCKIDSLTNNSSEPYLNLINFLIEHGYILYPEAEESE